MRRCDIPVNIPLFPPFFAMGIHRERGTININLLIEVRLAVILSKKHKALPIEWIPAGCDSITGSIKLNNHTPYFPARLEF